ncbi:MAG: MotA/TolQ/ExbB proton channel family protein [Oscillospiraceae bacterium]|nr:MotA/TolQ/ExbB proton channel family protein [Oscillospiraceae bacterium]
MNFSFTLGILVSVGLVVASMLSGNGSFSIFVDFNSFLIVFGGVVGVLIACYDIKDILFSLKYLKVLFLNEKKYIPSKYVEQLRELAQEARMNGILSLENKANGIDDAFLKDALLMVVDAVDSEKIRNTLEMSVEASTADDMKAHNFYIKGSTLAPAFGMIGTLIGLIGMLNNMSDYSVIGPNMAVALITTFYGSMFANIFFVPVANKIMMSSENKTFCKELIIEGVLDIQAGETPQYISDKLSMMLTKSKRPKK